MGALVASLAALATVAAALGVDPRVGAAAAVALAVPVAMLLARRLARSLSGEMAREHEAWVVGLLSGLSRREQDDLLRLLAKAKEHAVEVTP